jgi:hypothetical protein
VNSTTAINPKALKATSDAFIQANDAHGFIALCQSVKAQTMALICEERSLEAKRLMEIYSNIFRYYTCSNPAFTLEILPLMPPNANSTVKLMGISPEIDDYLLEHKVDLDVISRVEDDACYTLIQWALSKNDMAYAEKVVQGVAHHLNAFPSSKESTVTNVSLNLLKALLHHDVDMEIACTPGIDEAIASLMTKNRGKMFDEEDYFLQMAKAGLRKALMRALELESFYSYKVCTKEKRDIFFAALPDEPTSQEMYWIFRSIEFTVDDGIESQILFNERIDIQEHIETLRSTLIGQGKFCELSMSNLDRFSQLLGDDELNTPSRRNRAVAFVNAICEQEATLQGRQGTPEVIRNTLIDLSIPHTIIRQVKMLRGLELEDALGL